ncbi:hypothetical protein [Cytophaga aurantiaca]|uniref:hypothetical protein n=1 Tax=Cytophaga aurantiaca TaxID=29530 RepID=UPI00037F72FD|nr:hypothetical protein [Cytophaga aurantiaca]
MSYIDIFIPLAAGIIFLAFPDILIQKQDASYHKKKSLFKKGGLILLGVSIIYTIVVFFGPK